METVYDRMFMIMYNNKIAPLVRFHRLHTEACSSGNIIEQKKRPQCGFKSRRLLSVEESQHGAKRQETDTVKQLDGKSKEKNRETLSLWTRFSEAEEKSSVRHEVGFRRVQGKER